MAVVQHQKLAELIEPIYLPAVDSCNYPAGLFPDRKNSRHCFNSGFDDFANLSLRKRNRQSYALALIIDAVIHTSQRDLALHQSETIPLHNEFIQRIDDFFPIAATPQKVITAV